MKTLFTLRRVALALALAGTTAALAQSGGDYQIIRQVTVAGGGISTGGANYRLQGTIAQPDAGADTLQGGGFSLRGGYWSAASEQGGEPGGDRIFADGFETTGGTP